MGALHKAHAVCFSVDAQSLCLHPLDASPVHCPTDEANAASPPTLIHVQRPHQTPAQGALAWHPKAPPMARDQGVPFLNPHLNDSFSFLFKIKLTFFFLVIHYYHAGVTFRDVGVSFSLSFKRVTMNLVLTEY